MLVLAVLAATAFRYDLLDLVAPNPEIVPPAIAPPGWKVTRRISVNRVLIVEGESRHPEWAAEIARSIVRASSQAYDEVLVYVRAPGERIHARRVQWTNAGGYRVLDY